MRRIFSYKFLVKVMKNNLIKWIKLISKILNTIKKYEKFKFTIANCIMINYTMIIVIV